MMEKLKKRIFDYEWMGNINDVTSVLGYMTVRKPL